MKTITVLILTTAALALAAPNGAANPAILSTLTGRQTCVYSCGCQDDQERDGPDPDTAPCCASVGGILGNEGTVCFPPNFMALE